MSLRTVKSHILLIASLLCFQHGLAQDFADRFTVIDSVDYLIGEYSTPPADQANWASMDLPFGTRLGNETSSDTAIWMRFEIPKPDSDVLHSLYFHRYNLSIDVYLNGELIGGDTHKDGRFTTSWNHPRLVNIQNANWKDQDNTVHIRHKTSYFGGAFSTIVFGQTEELNQLWENTYFKRIEVSQWLQLLGLLVLALAIILWLMRRDDLSYLFLAGMAASWTVLTTHMVVYYNLVEYRYWLPTVHLALHIFSFLYYKLLTHLSEYQNPLIDKLAIAWLMVAIAWNQFGPFLIWWMGTYSLHAIGSLSWIYLLFQIIGKAIKTKNRLAIAISAAVAVQLLLFAHDFLMIIFGQAEQWETGMYLSQFAFPFLLIVFAGILLERFRSALSLAEQLNRELEAKVDASRKVIQESFEQRRQLELDQATEKQRLEIYRDLHDDVGSKLLSIVHAGQDEKPRDLARNALKSLRNAVSKANSEQQSLSQLLININEESQLRLEGSGHTFNWQQPSNLPELPISANTVFNLNQIFRELVSNIIRHARADRVSVCIAVSSDQLKFSIEDNGEGFNDSNAPGNGLQNVKQRVSEIGGSIAWHQPNDSGVGAVIEIPLRD